MWFISVVVSVQNAQPDHQGLDEILFERAEKGLGCTAVISFYHAQCAVIQRCHGRSYGDDGDTAENEQKIGDHQISDLAEKNMNYIVFV